MALISCSELAFVDVDAPIAYWASSKHSHKDAIVVDDRHFLEKTFDEMTFHQTGREIARVPIAHRSGCNYFVPQHSSSIHCPDP